jgi:hypothetical protein
VGIYCERVRGNLANMTIEEKRTALEALNFQQRQRASLCNYFTITVPVMKGWMAQ